MIWVKDEVRLHKHNYHIENVYVISGKGEFRLSDKIFQIKKGDYINIPKNTPHSVKVTSRVNQCRFYLFNRHNLRE